MRLLIYSCNFRKARVLRARGQALQLIGYSKEKVISEDEISKRVISNIIRLTKTLAPMCFIIRLYQVGKPYLIG